MRRGLEVSAAKLREWADAADASWCPVIFPIVVDWPELQPTEEQMLANAAALAYDKPYPYPEHIFPGLINLKVTR